MNFEKTLEKYLNHVQLTKAAGTYKCYSSHKTFPLNFFGNISIKKINTNLINKYIEAQKKRNPKIKNATINKHLKLIRQAYKFVLNKPLDIQLLKEEKNIISIVDEDTINMILDYYEENLNKPNLFRNYIMIRILLDTGVRLSELLNIKVSDIDFKKKIIHLKHTKAKKERIVFFRENTLLFLIKFIENNNIENFLFINFSTRNQLAYDTISRIFGRLEKQFNINKSLSPHKWRHTFATNFVRKSGSIEALRQIMGHEDLETTQQYLHLTNNDLMNAYNNVME